MTVSWSFSCKTTCLWTFTSCFENDSRLSSYSKTKNKNWILIHYMGECYTWCSLGIHLRNSIVHHIFMQLIFGTWKLLLRKLCRWHHSLYFSKQYSRKTRQLTNITQRLFTWFANNQMKANHGKCHLLLSKQEDANIQESNTTINCSRSQKLSGIVFDNKLQFSKHIENIYHKANRKSNVLERVTN